MTKKIYNINGDLLRTISVNATADQQSKFNYDCKNESGVIIPSGIYLVKADGPGLVAVKKMVITK